MFMRRYPQTNFTLNSVGVLNELPLFYVICVQRGPARSTGSERLPFFFFFF